LQAVLNQHIGFPNGTDEGEAMGNRPSTGSGRFREDFDFAQSP